MRIVPPDAGAELSAARRIRNAALRSFADHGVYATSMRRVARLAKVSVGLVQYYFKSKGGLRRAVDKFVLDLAMRALGKPVGEGSAEAVSTEIAAHIVELLRSHPHAVAYARRSLLEADRTSFVLFDTLFELVRSQLKELAARGLLRDDIDLDWAALHVIFVNVGPILLEPAVNRHFDHPLLSDEGLDRFQKNASALFLYGLYKHEPRTDTPGTSQEGARKERSS